MRKTTVLWIAALALAPDIASAQSTGTPPPAQASASQEVVTTSTPWTGTLDFGVRGTSLDGDPARYERYRDLGDGLFLDDLRVNREKNGWLLDFLADHVGRRDQRYVAAAERPGKLKASFLWDQIPMTLSVTTLTLFDGVEGGDLEIDNAVQAATQASSAALSPLFDARATQFDLRTKRQIANGGVEYMASPALTLTANFKRTNRDGTIPFGGSFGHSSLVELPAPTDHDISQFDGGAEFVRNPLLLRAGYSGSWFHNDVTSVLFDNPFRLTDITSTTSTGHLALPPSNSFIGVNGLASVKLPYRSRATAYLSFGSLKDAGDPMIPQTSNTSFTPLPIERSTVEGEAQTSSVNLTFVSRPTRYVDINVRYKTYEYDNETPEFILGQRISYDNFSNPLTTPIHTEPFSLMRHTFDADARWTLTGRTAAGIGYSRVGEDRTHRIFTSTADNVFRLTFDTLDNQWFTVRTKYEHAERRGEGIEQGIEELVAINEQPGMRHYDVASRNRNRVTVLGTLTPLSNLSATVSVAAGKDDYLESEFGLRDNTHEVYTFGADFLPRDRVVLGGSYSYEHYTALNRSRQADNTSAEQFGNPARNWAADGNDRVHSVLLSLGISRIAEKVDLNLAYDFNRARATYDYITGPVPDRTLPEEVEVPTVLPPPEQLPPTLSELQRATADLVYTLTSRLSLGFSYWYEKYRVEDFTLDAEAQPVLVRPGDTQVLLMGYIYRPYTANTFWGRLIVAF
jgi:MtrB/PioB family decaheme-associated outer membrane protein